MTFEEFLQKVSSKIGPKNALDLSRDARVNALEKLLIENTNLKQEDIQRATENEFSQLADKIESMPPLPQK